MNYYLLFFAAKESFAQRQLVLVLLPFPSPPPYWEGLGVGSLHQVGTTLHLLEHSLGDRA